MSNKPSQMMRSIGFNFIGAVMPVLLTLFTVPIYLHHVGAARYGVVLVAWSLLGYFGFMDLGLSRATTNALARLAHLDKADAKGRVFWSSLLINGALGCFGGLIMYLVGSYLFLHVLHIAPEVHDEALASVPYIAAMLPIALMLGVGVGTSEAHDRFGVLNLIQMAGLILGQVLPLVSVIAWGPSLLVIMPVMLGVRLLTFVAVTAHGMSVAGISMRPVVDFKVVRNLMSFGGWVAVTNIVSPIMTNADQFVIGALRTVSNIPFYAVPLNIISRTQIIPTTLTRTMFPMFSRLGKDKSEAIVSTTLMHLSVIMTLVYLGGIFLGGPFLRLWLGGQMAENGTPVLQWLCVGAWANSLAFVIFSSLQGQGRPRAVATVHSCEVLPYLGLLYFMVSRYGILGAAIAWTVRVTVDALILAIVAKIDRRCLMALVPGGLFLVAAVVVARMIGSDPVHSILATLVSGVLFVAVSLVSNHAISELLRVVAARRRAAA